jgi:hypothetical protein
MANRIVAGPILGFRGVKDGRWCTSALVVIQGNATQPALKFTIGSVKQDQEKATLLHTFGDRYVWRLEWAVTQTNKEQAIDYSINGGTDYRYTVPESNKPLRIAYGSCFGFSDLKALTKVKEKNAMWNVLLKQYKAKPYHLMMAGGDQVYADLMWETIPEMKNWSNLSIKDRVKASFTPGMKKVVEEFYFNLYCERWTQPEFAAALSQIPQINMWDDHDIFDGWGSYPKEQQNCPVFQGIYAQARDHFRLFQQQAKNDADLSDARLPNQSGFSFGFKIGDLAILALDMRSERKQADVMSSATWDSVYKWLDTVPAECKHLIVMSSIPLVYVNSNMLEDALGWIPGQQELEDDFKDQWVSRTHMEERLRLIHRLLLFSIQSKCRVTVVSGDVHVGALGYIESTRNPQSGGANVINQLISSGMNHPPPAGIVIYMMEKVMGDKVETVDRGITAQLLKFPGTPRRFIVARNWLSLTFDEKNRIWGEWYVEGEPTPYTKVINPVGVLTS